MSFINGVICRLCHAYYADDHSRLIIYQRLNNDRAVLYGDYMLDSCHGDVECHLLILYSLGVQVARPPSNRTESSAYSMVASRRLTPRLQSNHVHTGSGKNIVTFKDRRLTRTPPVVRYRQCYIIGSLLGRSVSLIAFYGRQFGLDQWCLT